VAYAEIMARVERRRKWTPEEKASLLAEVDAEDGNVGTVARRHRISPSLLYSWRSARQAAAERPMFVPVGVLGAEVDGPALPEPTPRSSAMTRRSFDVRPGVVEIELPGGVRVRVDGEVKAVTLRRVFGALRETR
jgi:transposase